ncbi:unnamed protein product [Cylindrotheca closterium]|uniref:Uncharacterized protein n=1 Tax=Cylindrotheca closterium TaxID=2856 RepID=A0AAD2CQ67_9STRA|nr:unnamed protein product [Cylindrotheca closterium]
MPHFNYNLRPGQETPITKANRAAMMTRYGVYWLLAALMAVTEQKEMSIVEVAKRLPLIFEQVAKQDSHLEASFRREAMKEVYPSYDEILSAAGRFGKLDAENERIRKRAMKYKAAVRKLCALYPTESFVIPSGVADVPTHKLEEFVMRTFESKFPTKEREEMPPNFQPCLEWAALVRLEAWTNPNPTPFFPVFTTSIPIGVDLIKVTVGNAKPSPKPFGESALLVPN